MPGIADGQGFHSNTSVVPSSVYSRQGNKLLVHFVGNIVDCCCSTFPVCSNITTDYSSKHQDMKSFMRNALSLY